MYGLSCECVKFDLEWPWKVKSRSSTSKNVHFQFYLQYCYPDYFDTYKTCSCNRFIPTVLTRWCCMYFWGIYEQFCHFFRKIFKSSSPEPLVRIVWNLASMCLKSPFTKIVQSELLRLFFYLLWIFLLWVIFI